MWVVHAAKDEASMDTLCSPNFQARLWARVYRANDLSLLLDNEVKDWIEKNEIELISIREVPLSG
jgi:hypothetical protein